MNREAERLWQKRKAQGLTRTALWRGLSVDRLAESGGQGVFARASKEGEHVGKVGDKVRKSKRPVGAGVAGGARSGRRGPGRARQDASAWVKRAFQLREEGRELEAMGHLREGLRQVGRSGALAQCLGLFHAAREDYEQAERWLTEAIGWEPRVGRHHYYLGMTYAAQHRFDQAVQSFGEAARLEGEQGEMASSWRLARQCAESDRGVHTADLINEWSSSVSGEAQGERASLSGLIGEEPDYVEAFVRGPGATPDRGELERVLAAVDEALSHRGATSGLCYERALLLERLGRIGQSVRWARRALSLDGSEKRAWVLLGKLYRQAGRTRKSAGALCEALRSGARYADVYLHLGEAYEAMGATAKARRHYERALSVNGRYKAARQALAGLGGE